VWETCKGKRNGTGTITQAVEFTPHIDQEKGSFGTRNCKNPYYRDGKKMKE
jgi:hypothetical protein